MGDQTDTEEDKALNLLQSVQENPHLSTKIFARINDALLLLNEMVHPYKVKPVLELFVDDFDRWLEFRKNMMKLCYSNSNIFT